MFLKWHPSRFSEVKLPSLFFFVKNCPEEAKAAINSMMKFCAKELAAKKIRINSVDPGMVNTKLIQSGVITEEQHKLDMEKYPLKRYGEPEEIAFGIIYLLSDASSWITGHPLVIDGGCTI